jgi:mono/diheme cytochrome c family protein
VNSYTGPDGNLYIVDMYRGIIQQGNWTRKGSFLRKKIDSLGLAKNINRGRIYRVVYDGMKPGPQPHMLEESSAELVHYLGHPNGWWRDNAQKLLIIRGDKSVVPALKQIALRASGVPVEDTSHLARIHALWTLEGLDAIDKPSLKQALADPDPQVRRTAVWISERYIQKGDDEMIDAVAALENDPSYDVRVQILLSSYGTKSKKAEMLEQSMLKNNAANEMITASYDALQKKTMVSELSAQLAGFNKDDKRTIMEGAVIFRSICANCHGTEGKGISIGNSAMPAPPLINATALRLDKKDMAIRILLHGMKGPVEGKSYPSEMPSMKENRDRWISSVLSYARYQFGDKDKKGAKGNITVSTAEVKAIRDKYADRSNPWTMDELKQIR